MISASRYPHGYTSLRSLAKSGVEAVVAVGDDDLPISASRYCNTIVPIPISDDIVGYKDALLGLAARRDVRTIIPHRPQDPYLLSKYFDEFDRHTNIVVPPFETLKVVHDRKRLMDVAEDAGVPVPKTDLLREVEEWESKKIIKSRYNLLTDEYIGSFGSNDSDVAKSIVHVASGETPDTVAIREEMNHDPIVQEYIQGAGEYVFGALYDHGKALATFQHRQIRGNSYTGSGGVYRESVHIPELEETGRTILDSIDWHGLACIEYVKDEETGEFKLIEINPRMWQSLACATHSGANFPHYYWLQATGQAEAIEPGYEVGIGTHWLYGELEHVVSVLVEDSSLVDPPSLPKTIGEILVSSYRNPTFDYLYLDDPFPTIHQINGIVRRRFDRLPI